MRAERCVRRNRAREEGAAFHQIQSAKSARSSPSPDFEPSQNVSCQHHPDSFARRGSRAAINIRRIVVFHALQSQMKFSHGPSAFPTCPSIAERHLLPIGTLVPTFSPRKPMPPIAPFAPPVPSKRGDYPVLEQGSKAKAERSVPRLAIDGSRTTSGGSGAPALAGPGHRVSTGSEWGSKAALDGGQPLTACTQRLEGIEEIRALRGISEGRGCFRARRRQW